MKYFTPERFVALQDFSSDEVMNAAAAAWDEAVNRYDAYYRSVEKALPPEYLRLDSSYYLHDGPVLYMAQQGDRFVIVVQLDAPPHPVLQLTYFLEGEAAINREALPPEHRGTGEAVEWMHDEIELVSENPLRCVHSILFSNGWEVCIPFRDLLVQEVQALIPVPRNGRVETGRSSVSQPA